jgi:hypothetical protein
MLHNVPILIFMLRHSLNVKQKRNSSPNPKVLFVKIRLACWRRINFLDLKKNVESVSKLDIHQIL